MQRIVDKHDDGHVYAYIKGRLSVAATYAHLSSTQGGLIHLVCVKSI